MINRSYEVPCNGCVRCCMSDAVRILPHEDASKWETEPHPMGKGMRMLAHSADGRCYYLGDNGCTIQNDKPQICREMDCRNIAQAMTFTQARKWNVLHVWQRGKDLLKRKTGEQP